MQVFREIDVSANVAELTVPTLVMHRRELAVMDSRAGLRLAQRIPGARLVMLEGDSVAPFLNDPEPVYQAIGDFLPIGHEGGESGHDHLPGGLRTILFTDLEGHTEMMQRLGAARGRLILRVHERLTRMALADYGGSEIKTLGDGFLASFPSAQKALECAVALQKALGGEAMGGVKVRMGINAGEPIAEDDDLFGASIITASRIAGQAKGDEVLVANVVRELVAGKGFTFSDRGQTELRGIEEPVRVWELLYS